MRKFVVSVPGFVVFKDGEQTIVISKNAATTIISAFLELRLDGTNVREVIPTVRGRTVYNEQLVREALKDQRKRLGIPGRGEPGYDGDLPMYRALQRALKQEGRKATPIRRAWMHRLTANPLILDWLASQPSASSYDVVDKVVVLHDCLAELTGRPNQVAGYAPERVGMTLTDQMATPQSKELELYFENRCQFLSSQPDIINNRLLSLRRYSRWVSDAGLQLQCDDYDWYHVVALNVGLKDGLVPAHYRNDIMPRYQEESSRFRYFNSVIPNDLHVAGTIITNDDCLVLTKRSLTQEFERGTVSATFEETMLRTDNSPFRTFSRALTPEEELDIPVRDAQLIAMHLEPEVNSVGFVIIARTPLESSDIGPHLLGRDRGEFDDVRSIWSVPLRDRARVVREFYEPDDPWGASGRLRFVAALCYVMGYGHAMELLGSGPI